MRARLVIAILATVLALTLGFLGRAVDEDVVLSLAGLFWIVAIVSAIALLPFWQRILPEVAPMPGLFQRPGHHQRWCTRCGTPADKGEPCSVCGHDVPVKEPKRPRSGRGAKAAGAKAKPKSKPRRS